MTTTISRYIGHINWDIVDALLPVRCDNINDARLLSACLGLEPNHVITKISPEDRKALILIITSKDGPSSREKIRQLAGKFANYGHQLNLL